MSHVESSLRDFEDPRSGGLERTLDYLPYPFLLSKVKNGERLNLFVNNRFLNEIGYECEEISTMGAWWDKAYPDPDYKKSVASAWSQLARKAEEEGAAEIVMAARITTKNRGPMWYQVKSSITPEAHLVAFVNIDESMRREEKLKARVETKNFVLSTLSHDLRSPISSLFSLTQLALSGSVAQEEFREILSKVNKKTSDVLGLLDLTLIWTRANFGAIQVNRSSVQVREILSNVLSLYTESLREKALAVSIAKELDQMVVTTDPQILTILVRNLLSNSIKFTSAGGTIHFSSDHDGRSVTLVDSGPGFSEEVIHRLGNHEASMIDHKMLQGGGAGLGLNLCIELAKHIDANIIVRNSETAGARVSIRFNKFD